MKVKMTKTSMLETFVLSLIQGINKGKVKMIKTTMLETFVTAISKLNIEIELIDDLFNLSFTYIYIYIYMMMMMMIKYPNKSLRTSFDIINTFH